MAEAVVDVAPAEIPFDVTPSTGETPTSVCQARTATGICGSGPHATKDGHCAKGHALPGNTLRKTHGLYSFRDRGAASLPADMRVTVADFKAQVISDRGGPEELSAIEVARIGHLAEVETTLRLLGSDIARNGLMTKKGRTRTVFGRWLEALDRWQKLAAHIGDGRRARTLPTLQEYLRAGTVPNAGEDVAGHHGDR